LRDGAVWSRIRLAERQNLEPWEPSAELDWEERHAVSLWPAVFAGLRSEARRGRMLPYVIEVDGRFRGQLTIGNVSHGALQSAWIGYWVASEVTGAGIATAALALGLDHCFGPVGLHRVEATVRPENAASRKVLSKVGFREEGLLKRYLDVDGGWRDRRSPQRPRSLLEPPALRHATSFSSLVRRSSLHRPPPTMSEGDREPCPYRVFEDMGGGFLLGACGPPRGSASLPAA
jgi:ribosomal-protein-alanine N-acetyltransferase